MRREYRRYRGGKRHIGILIPTLLILCIIAAGVLFYLNHHLAIGPEGMVLKLPFTEKTITFGGEKKEEVPLIIEKEPQQEQKEPEKSEEIKTPEPVIPEYEHRTEKSVFLPKEVVLDEEQLDAVLAKLAGSMINTHIMEIKAEDGTLAMSTTHAGATEIGLNEVDNTRLKTAIEKVTAAGLHPVAQISCFRDNKMPRQYQKLACRTKKRVIWLDYNNMTWLNPYEGEATGYITTVIEDAYALGFREVLLTNVSFPVDGKTSILYYSQEENVTKQEALKTFLSEIKLLCDRKKDLRIAARFDNYSSEREKVPGGQDLTDFAETFYRIYTPVKQNKDAEGLEKLYQKAAEVLPTEGFKTRFVPQIKMDQMENETDVTTLLTAIKQKETGFSLYARDGQYSKNILK